MLNGLKDGHGVLLGEEVRTSAEQVEAGTEGEAARYVLGFGDGNERIVVAVKLCDAGAA